VPPTPLGRVYRDLLGRANQACAARADDVFLIVAVLSIFSMVVILSGVVGVQTGHHQNSTILTEVHPDSARGKPSRRGGQEGFRHGRGSIDSAGPEEFGHRGDDRLGGGGEVLHGRRRLER